MQDKTCDHRCHESHNSSNLEELEVWSNRIDNSEGKTWGILIAALSLIGKFFYVYFFEIVAYLCTEWTLEEVTVSSIDHINWNHFYHFIRAFAKESRSLSEYTILNRGKFKMLYKLYFKKKNFSFFLLNHVFCVLANQIVRIGRKTHTSAFLAWHTCKLRQWSYACFWASIFFSFFGQSKCSKYWIWSEWSLLLDLTCSYN